MTAGNGTELNKTGRVLLKTVFPLKFLIHSWFPREFNSPLYYFTQFLRQW